MGTHYTMQFSPACGSKTPGFRLAAKTEPPLAHASALFAQRRWVFRGRRCTCARWRCVWSNSVHFGVIFSHREKMSAAKLVHSPRGICSDSYQKRSNSECSETCLNALCVRDWLPLACCTVRPSQTHRPCVAPAWQIAPRPFAALSAWVSNDSAGSLWSAPCCGGRSIPLPARQQPSSRRVWPAVFCGTPCLAARVCK